MQRAMQMQSGELDLALLTPKDAQMFADQEGYTCYDMKTSDYRGILFNFANEYWTENKDIIRQYATVLTGKRSFSLCCLGGV